MNKSSGPILWTCSADSLKKKNIQKSGFQIKFFDEEWCKFWSVRSNKAISYLHFLMLFLSFLEPDSSSPHSFLLFWKMAIRIFRRNKVIWVWNNLRMSKWQNFFFILGWTIPFHWGCVVQNTWSSELYCSLFQKKNISDINWSFDLWKSRSSYEIYPITQRLILS